MAVWHNIPALISWPL